MPEHDDSTIQALSFFLLDYAAALLAAGTHTDRCVRCTKRIAEAYGCKVAIVVSQKHVTLSLADGSQATRRYTSINRLHRLAFNLSRIGLLSALSWRAADDRLPLPALAREFRLIMAMGMRPAWLITLCLAAANASFCRLFGGDPTAMALVFAATAAGFAAKRWLMGKRVNPYGVTVACSFISGVIASLGIVFGWGSTAEIALSTSVLYLVPGVQIINALMDLINGYPLNSYQRGIDCALTIACMAVGLALTVLAVGVHGFSYL